MAAVPAAGNPYTVEVEDGQIVVRVDADAISAKDVSDFLDYVYLENIRRKASLSDKEIARLADEVDRAVWKRLRPMVEAKLRGR
jgi:hypothetical protein